MDPLDAGKLLQPRDDNLGGGHRLVEADAAGGLLQELDAFADRGRLLGPESRQSLDQSVVQSLLQVGDALDVQLVIERLDRLGPDARDAEQLQQRGRDLGQQFLMGCDAAGLDEFLDLGQRGLADAGGLGQCRRSRSRTATSAGISLMTRDAVR